MIQHRTLTASEWQIELIKDLQKSLFQNLEASEISHLGHFFHLLTLKVHVGVCCRLLLLYYLVLVTVNIETGVHVEAGDPVPLQKCTLYCGGWRVHCDLCPVTLYSIYPGSQIRGRILHYTIIYSTMINMGMYNAVTNNATFFSWLLGKVFKCSCNRHHSVIKLVVADLRYLI